jgi:hypothetical protein
VRTTGLLLVEPYGSERPAAPARGDLQALNGLEVGGELVGWEAAGGPVEAEDAVPTALEAVGGEGGRDGKFARPLVKGPVAAEDSGAGYHELGADEEAIVVGSGGAEDLLMEIVEGEFVAFGIFAPRNKEATPTGVVGIGKKAKPVEIRNVFVSVDKGPEALVQIRRVIEGMSLNKDGGIGQRFVALG